MHRKFLAIMIVTLALGAAGAYAQERTSQITLTFAGEGEVSFFLEGEGQVTIDWGDGTPVETRELAGQPEYPGGFGDEHTYSHVYSGASALVRASIAGPAYAMTCGTGLRDLDVSKSSLVFLACDGNANQLGGLDVSENKNLYYLALPNNQLTDFDVSKNTNLSYFDCSNNQLTALDVSKNAELGWLDCSNNQLTSLDLSKNLNLGKLNCSDNQLTGLDVSKNIELQELYCANNQLTGLTIGKNLNRLGAADLSSNRLQVSVLHTIFTSLHSGEVAYGYEGQVDEKVITVAGNPGADACDTRIAAKKGWEVTR